MFFPGSGSEKRPLLSEKKRPPQDSSSSSSSSSIWILISGLILFSLLSIAGFGMAIAALHNSLDKRIVADQITANEFFVTEKNTIRKWETGCEYGRDNLNMDRLYVIAEQDVLFQNNTDFANPSLRLYPNTFVRPDMYPVSQPEGDPDSDLSANTFREELWVVFANPETEENNIFGTVASIENNGTSLVLTHMHFYYGTNQFADVVRGYGASNPNFGNHYKLMRVRVTNMPYSTWVVNPDNHGNAIIKAKYAVNARRRSPAGLIYLMMAKYDETKNRWIRFLPALDAPAMLQVDNFQVATWKVSGLEAGALYGAFTAIPSPALVTMFNADEGELSPLFLQELQFAYGAFYSTSFRMPYAASAKNQNVKMAFYSCVLAMGEENYKVMKNGNYDFIMPVGDFSYSDTGHISLVRFNLRNSAGNLLGFGPVARYLIPGTTISAASPVSFPVTFSTTARRFLVEEKLKVVATGTYNNMTSLIAVLQPLFGSNIIVGNTSDTLTLLQVNASEFGYDQAIANAFKQDEMQKAISNSAIYATIDDHEVSNDFHSLPVIPVFSVGTPLEVSIVNAVRSDPNVAVYGFSFWNPLSTTPVSSTAISASHVNTALRAFDRYLPRQFVNSGSVHNNTGYVRWGDVELIKLDSTPKFDTELQEFVYYQLQEKFMADEELLFLTERLSKSTAKVKIVVYSRQLSMSYYSFDDIAAYREKFIGSAVSFNFSAVDAAIAFDKVFRYQGRNFINGYIPWFNQTFIPSITATGAKNVFFVSGGNHYGTAQYLAPGSDFVEIHVPAFGIGDNGRAPQGTKYGVDPMFLTHSKNFGYVDIQYVASQNKLAVSYISLDETQNKIEFKLK